jgi:hypothetical protein
MQQSSYFGSDKAPVLWRQALVLASAYDLYQLSLNSQNDPNEGRTMARITDFVIFTNIYSLEAMDCADELLQEVSMKYDLLL